MSIDGAFAYVNSYFKDPSDPNVELVKDFAGSNPDDHIHDWEWVGNRMEEVLWRLVYAAPIWCNYDDNAEGLGCGQFPNTMCIRLGNVDADGFDGFCAPEEKLKNNSHAIPHYRAAIKAHANYLTAMDMACGLRGSDRLRVSAQLRTRFCGGETEETSKHVFGLIKIFPLPSVDNNRPVGVACTRLDGKIWLPDALIWDYFEFWLMALRAWRDEFHDYSTANDDVSFETLVSRIGQRDLAAAAKELFDLMKRVEDGLNLPCLPEEYPCRSVFDLGSGQVGLRCVPSP